MPFVSQSEAAAAMGCAPRTLSRKLAKGEFETKRDGRRVLVWVESKAPDAVAALEASGRQLSEVATANAIQRAQDADVLAAFRQTMACEAQRARTSARWAWLVAVAAMAALTLGAVGFHRTTFALTAERVAVERTADGLRHELTSTESERDAARAEAEAARKDADETFRVFAGWLLGEPVAAARE